MKNIVHPLFSLTLPEDFEVIHENEIMMRIENRSIPHDYQPNFVRLYLLEIADLDNTAYEGETLREKYGDSCLSSAFQAEKLSVAQIDFRGYETFIVHSKTDAVFMERHYKIRQFNAAIFVDDTYYVEVTAMTEMTTGDELAAWVQAMFETITIHGDKAFRTEVMNLYLAEMDKPVEFDDAVAEALSYEPLEIPENKEDGFQIGDFNCSLVASECVFEITEVSREFDTKVVAKVADIALGKKKGLLSEYDDGGKVAIRFSARGIHQNGIPTGKFNFEDGKTGAPLHMHMYLEGFDTALDFHGTIEFKESWILISGFLKHGWEKKPEVPVKVVMYFESKNLDWREYRFHSLEETSSVPPEDVRFLQIENPAFTSLPDTLFTFKNLHEFSISQRSNHWETEKLPLCTIQEAIGKWTRLTNFHINGAAIEAVPESFGKLENLVHLSINNCLLKGVPKGVWRLPKLKYLWLSNNELVDIPETIDMPELSSISLEGNQLKTLPQSLAEQPQLKSVAIEDNPLETLPKNFNSLYEVKLDITDKKRLLDFGYKGADGKGLVPWDDSIFYSLNDDSLVSRIHAVITANGLSEYGPALRSTVKKAIGFVHTGSDDYNQIGNHRFGGMPDLPKEMKYPVFLDSYHKKKFKYEFIGQINCGEVAEMQEYLPRKGMLYFFLETLHNIYGGNENPCKVVYVTDTANLVSGKRFQFAEEDYFEMFDVAYSAFSVKANKINSAPSFYASHMNEHLFRGEAELLKDKDDLLEALYETFEEPMREGESHEYYTNAYGFTQHESPELQASLKLRGNPEDWMVLLTVTSAGDMQWGDAGDLFYVIHKSDLAKRDFSNVFVTLESS